MREVVWFEKVVGYAQEVEVVWEGRKQLAVEQCREKLRSRENEVVVRAAIAESSIA